jgi:uncharacterized membrane protein
MSGLMRCKACGLIISGSRIKDVCPACGLPRTVFEEYEERISPERKFLLSLDLHPIAVHFPQALAVLAALFIFGGLLLKTPLASELLSAARLLLILLPFSVLGAIAAGILDGRTRFRRLGTPMLIRKMIVSGILLVLTVIALWLILQPGLDKQNAVPVLVLSLGCIGCEIVLGKTGSKLMCVRIGG